MWPQKLKQHLKDMAAVAHLGSIGFLSGLCSWLLSIPDKKIGFVSITTYVKYDETPLPLSLRQKAKQGIMTLLSLSQASGSATVAGDSIIVARGSISTAKSPMVGPPGSTAESS